MRFFIRTDASAEMGTGHVMRCLTLADELRKNKHEVWFIYKKMPIHFIHLFESKGINYFRYETITQDDGSVEDARSMTLKLMQLQVSYSNMDWLIIDHYGIDHIWEDIVRPIFSNIMVIDDLANRRHTCELLLDTNLSDVTGKRYDGLVSKETIKLLGPEYALLREEFGYERSQMLASDRILTVKPRNVLVCFGGTDPTNETFKVIRAIEHYILQDDSIVVTVVLGKANPHIKIIENQYTNHKQIRLCIQPSSMALEMVRSHFAICGGGTMTWERYCMGLPAIVIAIADNQVNVAKQGDLRGIDRYIGESENVTEEEILSNFQNIVANFKDLKQARQLALEIVDGQGAVRVMNALEGIK
ncbi:UDP-2,4-diacetamido-2,4,6-trideoxy-beta-L-altropyranose hydrolase [compost metagenome]